MKHLLKVFCLLILGFNANLVANPKPSLLTEGSVGVFNFKLNNNKVRCELIIDADKKLSGIFSLESESPCYFFADIEQKKIQTYSYKGVTVLLIGGTAVKLAKKEKESKKIPLDRYCTQNIEAILIEKDQIKHTHIEPNALACAEDRLDEIMYQQMSKKPGLDIQHIEKQQEQSEKPMTAPEASFFERLRQKIETLFQ